MHIKRIWTNHLMPVTPPGTRKLAGSANAVHDQAGRKIVSIIWFERSHTHVARAMSKGDVPNAMFHTAMVEDSEEPTTRYLPSGENAAEQRYRYSLRALTLTQPVKSQSQRSAAETSLCCRLICDAGRLPVVVLAELMGSQLTRPTRRRFRILHHGHSKHTIFNHDRQQTTVVHRIDLT